MERTIDPLLTEWMMMNQLLSIVESMEDAMDEYSFRVDNVESLLVL